MTVLAAVAIVDCRLCRAGDDFAALVEPLPSLRLQLERRVIDLPDVAIRKLGKPSRHEQSSGICRNTLLSKPLSKVLLLAFAHFSPTL